MSKHVRDLGGAERVPGTDGTDPASYEEPHGPGKRPGEAGVDASRNRKADPTIMTETAHSGLWSVTAGSSWVASSRL